MELSVRDSAKILNVSEKTIYRLDQDKGAVACIPSDEQYRLNRVNCWSGYRPGCPSLARDVHYAGRIGRGGARRSPPRSRRVVSTTASRRDKHGALPPPCRMPIAGGLDRGLLLDIILARESLGSTGIGDGIAMPHVRNPIFIRILQPLVTLLLSGDAGRVRAVDGRPGPHPFHDCKSHGQGPSASAVAVAFALRQAGVCGRDRTAKVVRGDFGMRVCYRLAMRRT